MSELLIPSQLMPVAIEALRPNSAFEFDLFLRAGAQQTPVLYREHHYPIEAADVRSLSESGIQTLYIAERHAEAFERYVREFVISDLTIPPAGRYKILQDISRAGFLTAHLSDCPARIVESAARLAPDLVGLLCDDDLILADLFRVMQHDYCTFTHAANVCAYCLALAETLGITDRGALTTIAVGALLHDIGKRKISPAILNKPGRLTKGEYEQVKKHPRDGFEELALRRDLGWGQLMMVYQHHERPDGRGYPVGVEQDEIHPWAELCSVVDVFDALTSERPYRRPMSAADALAYLQRNAGKQFNGEMVQCWICTMTQKR
ncbi:MAG TPA: HD domain-containing phosphohydrolase [Pirellulales bacterium]|nr:HD domain-containing phosphohydrolase [Pirellulales bacterium]